MRGRILVVEDDAALAAMYSRVLGAHGYDVALANDGASALALASQTAFDVVISDIGMPRMDGVELLRQLRQQDPWVPVILLTGQPAVETAQTAIELQAFRYLVKPVDLRALTAAVKRAAIYGRWVRAQRDAAAALPTNAPAAPASHECLDTRFEEALRLLCVYFSPIVASGNGILRGFKVLARSPHPSFSTFEELLRAADRLGRRNALRRKLWALSTAPLGLLPDSLLLFVWTDLAGLADEELTREGAAIARLARQTVLVVSERGGIDERCEHRDLGALRSRGYRIGLDRLGDGYAGLNSLAWLEPEFVELDPSLVCHLADNPEQQRVLRAVVLLATELGAEVVAEGVTDERDQVSLCELGCELLTWGTVSTPDELSPISSGTISDLRHAPQ